MRLNAAASTAIDAALSARPRAVELLGVLDEAIYLRDPDSASVVAVLTSDAVRLPCGLVLGASSVERPLRRLEPRAPDAIMMGNGCVQWTGPVGTVTAHVVRRWEPPVVAPAGGDARMSQLAELQEALEQIDLGLDAGLLVQLAESVGDTVGDTVADTVGDTVAQSGATLALLGYGPGLTPSGDDVLAGLLVGARAFGVDVSGVRAAIAEAADARTTALSSQLLRHAAAGQVIAEVASLLAALVQEQPFRPALARLLQVGHTSGAALARGVLIAGRFAAAQPAAAVASTVGGAG